MNNVVVTRQGWFGRIGNSVKGIFIGIFLVLGSIALLAWNEHRTIKRSRGLAEARSLTVDAPADRIDPALAGKLVHVAGTTRTAQGARDPEFGLQRPALALRREVEMYQWREKKSTKKETSVGGTETTTTTYSYEKVWDDDRIDSSRFHNSAGHQNPGSFPVQAQRFDAPDAMLGAYRLNAGQIGSMAGWVPVAAPPLPSGWRNGANPSELYRGNDPGAPQVGDVRVRFAELPTGPVSVIAAQQGDGFGPYTTGNGSVIDLLEAGSPGIEKMFQNEQSSNSMLGWILRAVGFVLMWIGFSMMLGPLAVLASVLPFLGRLVGGATGLVAFVIAAALSALTIVIAWLAVRPVLVIGIVGGVLLLLFGLGKLRGARAPAAIPPGPAPGSYVPPPAPGAYIPPPPPPPPGSNRY